MLVGQPRDEEGGGKEMDGVSMVVVAVFFYSLEPSSDIILLEEASTNGFIAFSLLLPLPSPLGGVHTFVITGRHRCAQEQRESAHFWWQFFLIHKVPILHEGGRGGDMISHRNF